jgi:hypothetical protein
LIRPGLERRNPAAAAARLPPISQIGLLGRRQQPGNEAQDYARAHGSRKFECDLFNESHHCFVLLESSWPPATTVQH